MAKVLSEFILENSIKGFLADEEGLALERLAYSVAKLGPCLELGSYCGKSTLYLGAGCKSSGNILFAIDHHRGSEEHQPGEEYHDRELYDPSINGIDSFPQFRRTLQIAELEANVIPIVADSHLVAQNWTTPLGLVFIDGSHSYQAALQDCLEWSEHIVSGGILAVHDIFPDPQEGGQGPYLALNKIIASGGWIEYPQIQSLAILCRK